MLSSASLATKPQQTVPVSGSNEPVPPSNRALAIWTRFLKATHPRTIENSLDSPKGTILLVSKLQAEAQKTLAALTKESGFAPLLTRSLDLLEQGQIQPNELLRAKKRFSIDSWTQTTRAALQTELVPSWRDLGLSTRSLHVFAYLLRSDPTQPTPGISSHTATRVEGVSAAFQRAVGHLAERFAPRIEGLARSLSAKFGTPELQQDCAQVARLSLLDILHRFEPARGVQLWTLANSSLSGIIRNFLYDNRSTARIPKWIQLERTRIRRDPALGDNTLAQGDQPFLLRRRIAIDTTPDSDDTPSLLEVLVASPEESTGLDSDESRLLTQAIEGLPARESTIIRQRFGLNDTSRRSLEDLGIELGITRERVRQLEARALEKLRKNLARLDPTV